MKDSYRTIIAFGQHQENVPQHDAIMVIPGSTAAGYSAGNVPLNGHFSAEIFPYGQKAIKGANGRALLHGSFSTAIDPDNSMTYQGDGSTYVAPTGDVFRINGITAHYGTPVIVPVQAKSIGALDQCMVYGLI